MKKDKKLQIIGHTILILYSILIIMPILLLIISSFTNDEYLIAHGYSLWPGKWSLDAYKYLFAAGSAIMRAYGISLLLLIVGTAASLMISTPLAYAISRKNMPCRGLITFLIFFTMLFNGGLVPTYMNYVSLFHIKNTFWGLLIPNLLTSALYILLIKSYFTANVPEEILEAASIDGAGEFRRFLKIALPLAKPIIATVVLFVATAYWNDWQNGYIYLSQRTDLYSIQTMLNVMIRNIQYLTQNSSGLANTAGALASIPAISVRMAIAVIGILPIMLIYPFIQKNIVKGIALGGVKG